MNETLYIPGKLIEKGNDNIVVVVKKLAEKKDLSDVLRDREYPDFFPPTIFSSYENEAMTRKVIRKEERRKELIIRRVIIKEKTEIGGGANEAITIEGLLMITSRFKLDEEKDFKFFYQFVYESAGVYQLNVCVTFLRKRNKDEEKSGSLKEYDFYGVSLTFKEGSIKGFNEQGGELVEVAVPLKEIKKVKVFLANKNPETSRGTVTTVQHTT